MRFQNSKLLEARLRQSSPKDQSSALAPHQGNLLEEPRVHWRLPSLGPLPLLGNISI